MNGSQFVGRQPVREEHQVPATPAHGGRGEQSLKTFLTDQPADGLAQGFLSRMLNGPPRLPELLPGDLQPAPDMLVAQIEDPLHTHPEPCQRERRRFDVREVLVAVMGERFGQGGFGSEAEVQRRKRSPRVPTSASLPTARTGDQVLQVGIGHVGKSEDLPSPRDGKWQALPNAGGQLTGRRMKGKVKGRAASHTGTKDTSSLISSPVTAAVAEPVPAKAQKTSPGAARAWECYDKQHAGC